MTSLLFAILAAIHLVITVVLVRRALAERSWYLALLALVALGLVYDNGMVAVGRFIGEGPVLESLNLPRFIIHALVTPVLIIVGFGLARRAGAGWAQRRWVHGAFCALATVLIGYGVVTELIGLQLEPGGEGDAVSYSAANPSLPVPSITVIVVLIAVGVAIIRRGGVWMTIGSVAMFVAAAIGSLPLVVANIGEVALIVGLMLTGMLPVPHRDRQDAPRP